jgi:hypothetical protein
VITALEKGVRISCKSFICLMLNYGLYYILGKIVMSEKKQTIILTLKKETNI